MITNYDELHGRHECEPLELNFQLLSIAQVRHLLQNRFVFHFEKVHVANQVTLFNLGLQLNLFKVRLRNLSRSNRL